MKFTIKAACGCNIGKIRQNNEDNLLFNRRCLPLENTGMRTCDSIDRQLEYGECMAVFDGMGGLDQGELASFTAARKMQEITSAGSSFFELGKHYLENLTDKINRAVADENKKLTAGRMGTTMAALFFSPDTVYSCNVGDSRTYLLRSNALYQLSRDDSSAKPQPDGRKAPLTQCLGLATAEFTVKPHIIKKELAAGDKLLICSDGITDMLSNYELADIMLCCTDPTLCVKELISAALENGGRDNITAIMCIIE